MIYIGCSGWFYEEWKGVFYPDSIKKSDWLGNYATIFDTVEANLAFYKLPGRKVIDKINEQSSENFRFAFKAYRKITHVKKLKESEKEMEQFYRSIFSIKDKLGPILWQIPPQFKKDTERLEKFVQKLSNEFRNVMEFRDPSWFSKEVYDVLKKYNVGFCISSAPNIPDDVIVTSDFAYIRFHGKTKWFDYDYSEEELKDWAKKIKKLKVKDVYCYFNNDLNANAPKNALELKKILKV